MFQDYILCNSQRFGVQILYRFYMMCSVLLLLLFAHFSGSFKKRNSIFFLLTWFFKCLFFTLKNLKRAVTNFRHWVAAQIICLHWRTEGSRAIQGLGRIQRIIVCFCVHLLAILSHSTSAINVLKLNHSQHQWPDLCPKCVSLLHCTYSMSKEEEWKPLAGLLWLSNSRCGFSVARTVAVSSWGWMNI